MARIVITRPNGETEYAELTTDKDKAGNDRLAVEKAGAVYYAKLDSGVSTHMYVIKPDGRKLYVQKKVVAFMWKYVLFNKNGINNTKDIDFNELERVMLKMVIPRTGKYRLTFIAMHTHGTGRTNLNTYYEDNFFIQGTKFSSFGEINAKNGKEYGVYNPWDNEKDEEDPEFEKIETLMESIEYIGEA